ncbi:hypothetical protein FQN54_005978 [Arachnomyces sp. PD_36]|nr:hypothetical protein FQN54_005978 [Arachnomyces sp. PD_36]
MAFTNLRALFSLSFALLFVLPGLAYKPLSDATLQSLPSPGDGFDIHKGELLAPILRPRVAGTPGSTAVLNHFVDFFKNSLPDWTIEFQNSTSKTPATGDKDVPFINFIASRDPPWSKKGDVGRLNLVAHYDSKYEPEGFIGATDSAAPCAIIMHAVRSIDAALTKKWADMQADGSADLMEDHTGIQVIFLDGEEAFHTWTKDDSLYGARSLAENWEHEANTAMSTYKTPLSAISLFFLLDLLGAKNPNMPSYFKTTHWAYQDLAVIEDRLRKLDQFKTVHQFHEDAKRSGATDKNKAQGPQAQWFSDRAKNPSSTFRSYIQDDHLPFMARGVEILHAIPYPFPDVWHDITDDAEHLDIPTVEDWAMIITAFAAEWMELEGHFETHGISNDNEAISSGAAQKRDDWDKPEL